MNTGTKVFWIPCHWFWYSGYNITCMQWAQNNEYRNSIEAGKCKVKCSISQCGQFGKSRISGKAGLCRWERKKRGREERKKGGTRQGGGMENKYHLWKGFYLMEANFLLTLSTNQTVSCLKIRKKFYFLGSLCNPFESHSKKRVSEVCSHLNVLAFEGKYFLIRINYTDLCNSY